MVILLVRVEYIRIIYWCYFFSSKSDSAFLGMLSGFCKIRLCVKFSDRTDTNSEILEIRKYSGFGIVL